jgi:hypothetical protein
LTKNGKTLCVEKLEEIKNLNKYQIKISEHPKITKD